MHLWQPFQSSLSLSWETKLSSLQPSWPCAITGSLSWQERCWLWVSWPVYQVSECKEVFAFTLILRSLAERDCAFCVLFPTFTSKKVIQFNKKKKKVYCLVWKLFYFWFVEKWSWKCNHSLILSLRVLYLTDVLHYLSEGHAEPLWETDTLVLYFHKIGF